MGDIGSKCRERPKKHISTNKANKHNKKISYAIPDEIQGDLYLHMCMLPYHQGTIGYDILETRDCLHGCEHYKRFIEDPNPMPLRSGYLKKRKEEKERIKKERRPRKEKKEEDVTNIYNKVARKNGQEVKKIDNSIRLGMNPHEEEEIRKKRKNLQTLVQIEEEEKERRQKEIILAQIREDPSLIGLYNTTLIRTEEDKKIPLYDLAFENEDGLHLFKYKKIKHSLNNKGIKHSLNNKGIEHSLRYELKVADPKEFPEAHAIYGTHEETFTIKRTDISTELIPNQSKWSTWIHQAFKAEEPEEIKREKRLNNKKIIEIQKIQRNPALIGLDNAEVVSTGYLTDKHFDLIFEKEGELIVFKHSRNPHSKQNKNTKKELTNLLKTVGTQNTIPSAILGNTQSQILKKNGKNWTQ